MASARVTIGLPFYNDRRQGLVINANRFPRCAILRHEILARFIKWVILMSAIYDYAADCQRFSRGRRRRGSMARIERSGGGFPTICGSRRATYDLTRHRHSHPRGLAGLAIPENGRPREVAHD